MLYQSLGRSWDSLYGVDDKFFLSPRNAKVCLLKRLSFAGGLSLRTTHVCLSDLYCLSNFSHPSPVLFFFNAKPKLMGQIQTSVGLDDNPQCRLVYSVQYVLHEYGVLRVSFHIQPPIPCLSARVSRPPGETGEMLNIPASELGGKTSGN